MGTTTLFFGVNYSNTSGTLYVSGGSAALGYPVTTGVWYLVDVKVDMTINPTLIDVSVNGVALPQATSPNSGTFTSWSSGNNTSFTADFFIDDFVCSNTLGDYPIGAGAVYHFVPTSDGTHNVAGAADFKRGAAGTDILNSTTDSYLLIDEVPMDDTTADTDDYINAIAPPNATDYVEHVFGPAPGVPTPIHPPRAVEIAIAHHQFGTTSGNCQFRLNDNGTEDTILSLSGNGVTTIRYARKHYANMVAAPVGPWTLPRFQNLRHRFGFTSDANPDQYFDCAMIEAEFDTKTYLQTNNHLFPRCVSGGVISVTEKIR
jgi:hypothetical protein